MNGLADAHQARYNKPPRRIDYRDDVYGGLDHDNPCPACRSPHQTIIETHRVSGPIRPASMGPEEPHVKIKCARCGLLLDEFDA